MKNLSLLFYLASTILILSCSEDKEEHLPVVITETVSLHAKLVTCGSRVTSEGSGPVNVLGICWSTRSTPTLQDNFTASPPGVTKSSLDTLKNFVRNTTYYIRAYATSSAGTSYGEEREATLYLNHPEPDVTDIDGNVYKTVRIGDQVWMVENLKTSRYRNGDAIPQITSNDAWLGQTSGAWCYYNNDVNNGNIYGKLYNIHTTTDPRNIAPPGWRIPIGTDWFNLGEFIGSNCHEHMQEAGSVHWKSLNTAADNLTGFTALPSGERDTFGYFGSLGHEVTWWCSGRFSGLNNHVYSFGTFGKNECDVVHSTGDRSGFAIRCIKE